MRELVIVIDLPAQPGLVSSDMPNPLVANWRMVACRGGLAILFGLSVVCWPRLDLGVLAMLFAAYVFLDGVCTLASVFFRVSARVWEWWPVILEGMVSIGLGILAVVWPFAAARRIGTIVAWGVLTGVLEMILAARLPRELESHWLLAAGGAASLFLAVLVWMLPHAVLGDIAWALGVYALVFGVLVFLAARRLRRAARGAIPAR